MFSRATSGGSEFMGEFEAEGAKRSPPLKVLPPRRPHCSLDMRTPKQQATFPRHDCLTDKRNAADLARAAAAAMVMEAQAV